MVDNRTDPLFQGTSKSNSINLGITTLCSMRCPMCSLAMPALMQAKQAKHVSVATLIECSRWMQDLRRVHITGGEPTIHPKFEVVVGTVAIMFRPEYLTIETNGAQYAKYRDVFRRRFDRVFITHYLKDAMYPGSPDNTATIELAERDLGARLIREAPVTHSRAHADDDDGSGPCSKYHDPGLPAGLYDGKLYGCCVTFGIDRNLGIPVTERWREDIARADMGCGRCLFRGT
jgi:hypothetical protein